MVVGDLAVVEHAFAFLQRFATDGFDEFCIGCDTTELRLVQTVHRLRTFGIDVVGEVLRVHTGIGGELLLIEGLNEV